MGQAASIYAIDDNAFNILNANPDDFEIHNFKKFKETFEKTFDGLIFVLSKAQSNENIALVSQIFYPITLVGETIDIETIDFNNFDPDIDLLEESIYYNEPKVVNSIAAFLENFSIEQFVNNFDFKELNHQQIYPQGVWNNSSEPNEGFNKTHMTAEFVLLKDFYKKASELSCYVLSYVG